MNKQKLDLLTKTNGIPHNNNYGFYLHELKNRTWFTKNFKAITYSYDKLKYKVVNTIEHKKYPIFGIHVIQSIVNVHDLYMIFLSHN